MNEGVPGGQGWQGSQREGFSFFFGKFDEDYLCLYIMYIHYIFFC